MVKAASEALGLQAMARDFGTELAPWMYVDATAAMGVAQRVGLGKLRHLDTQSLWLQQAIRQKRIGLSKVLGTVNPADLMTKYTDSSTLERLLVIMSLERREGRAEIAPHVEVEEVCAVGQVEQTEGFERQEQEDRRMYERWGGCRKKTTAQEEQHTESCGKEDMELARTKSPLSQSLSTFQLLSPLSPSTLITKKTQTIMNPRVMLQAKSTSLSKKIILSSSSSQSSLPSRLESVRRSTPHWRQCAFGGRRERQAHEHGGHAQVLRSESSLTHLHEFCR